MAMDSPLYFGSLKNTPLGDLWVAVSETGLAAVEWDDDRSAFDAYLTKRLKRPASPIPKGPRSRFANWTSTCAANEKHSTSR